jgi:hypothetical protein
MPCPCTKTERETTSIPQTSKTFDDWKLCCSKFEDWSDVYAAEEIDEKVNVFTSTMLTIMDGTIPERTVRTHPSEKPWMTRFIKTKIKARQRAFSRNDQVRYEQLCVTVSRLIPKAKTSYITDQKRKIFARQTQLNGLSPSSHFYESRTEIIHWENIR